MRLRAKILLSTVIPLAILVALVIRWDLMQTREEVATQVKNHVRFLVRGSALLLDGELRRASQVANTAALAFADVGEWTTEETKRFAHSIVAHDPVIYGFSIAWDRDKGPSGKGLEAMSARRSDSGVENFNLAELLDYTKDNRYETVRRTRQPLWSDSLHGTRLENVDIVLYLAPILSESKFLGATVVDVEVDRLSALRRRIGLRHSLWWLLDQNGKLIGKSDDLGSGTTKTPSDSDQDILKMVMEKNSDGTSLFEQARDDKPISVIRTSHSEIDGQVVLALSSVPLTNWVLVSARSFEEQLAPIRDQVVIRAISSIVVGLMAILIVTLGVWWVVLRPIRKLDSVVQRVGSGDFDARAELHGKDELAMLGRQLNRTIPRVKELLETRASLEAAHEVQNALLPQEKFKGESIIVAGRSLSSEQIGGDFFDVVSGAKLGQGRTGMILGDVSGHGVPAALLAATARAYVRGALLEGVDLHSAITATNLRIHEDAGDTRFIVVLGAFFDASAHTLEVVAAGHPSYLLRNNASEFETINAQGIPLGIDSDVEFPQLRFDSIGNGDLFLIASDGIWESRNSNDEEFGIERLLNIVCEHRNDDLEQIIDQIFDQISAWHESSDPKDDCTIVIAKMLG